MAKHNAKLSRERLWIVFGSVMLALVGIPYAASSGSGMVLAAGKPTPSPSVTQNGNVNDPKAFDISGAPSNIAPGVTSSYMVTVRNNSSQAIRVSTVNGTVVPVSGCDTTKITVIPYNKEAVGAVTYKVEGKATAQILMKIVFTNTNTNQNGCKNKTLTINYTGTAEQW